MATRFRLTASTTAPAVSPALQSYSHNAPTTVRRRLIDKGNGSSDSSALTTTAYTPDSADDLVAGDALHGQLVSEIMAAGNTFTNAGVIKFAVQCLEAHANNNLQVQLFVSIVSQDGSTVQRTLRAKVLEGVEIATTITNRFLSTTQGGATYVTVAGDRLVVEFSVSGTPAATGGVQGHNASLRWGASGAGGDLAENDTDTGATLNPWIEFVPTIVWLIQGATIGAGSINAPTVIQTVIGATISATTVIAPTVQYVVTTAFIDSAGTMADTYGVANSAGVKDPFNGVGQGDAQSFLGDGRCLKSCKFYLSKFVGSVGTYVAKLYATTGTHGTNARPTGAALATSSPALAIEDLSETSVFTTLTFSTPVLLTNGVTYAIAIEVVTISSGQLEAGVDLSSPTHAGNYSFTGGGAWAADSSIDTIFEVITGSAVFPPSNVVVQPVTATIASGSALYAPALLTRTAGLGFAHGTINWTFADAVDATFVISGLAFQPKALRFYWVGIGSATDVLSEDAHWRVGVGFATSPTNRRCLSTLDFDNTDPTYCDSQTSDVAVVRVGNPALDLQSISSNGFTLVVKDQTLPVAEPLTIVWEAWGGDPITAVTIGEISEPSATGTQDYSAPGFVSGGTDQVLMFASCQQTGATPSWTEANSGVGIGFATGPSAQVVMAGGGLRNVVTTDTGRYAHNGECVAMCTSNSTGVDARAELDSFLTDGFRLDWVERAVTGRKVFYLAIKGGNWLVGSTTIDLTGANSAVVSGLSLSPAGISLLWHIDTECAAGVHRVDGFFSLGTGSSPSSREVLMAGSWGAQGNTVVNTTVQYDQIAALNFFGALGTLDLDAVGPAGFTIINDGPTDVTTDSFLAFLTYGLPVISTVAIASGSAATAPSDVATTGAGTQAVTTAFISSGTTVTEPTTVTPGAVTVVNGTVATGSALTAPTVAHAATGATIAAGTSVNEPTVAYAATTAAIATGSAVTQPTIIPGAVTVVNATISSGSALTQPTATYVAVGPTIPTGSAVTQPTVTPGAVTIGAAAISSGSLPNAPTSLLYAVTTAAIPTGSQLFTPTSAVFINTGTIASGEQRFAPTVSPGPALVTGPTIPTGSTLSLPTITTGAVTIVGGTIPAGSIFPPDVVTAGSISTGTISSTQLFTPTTTYTGVTATIPSGSSALAASLTYAVSLPTIATTTALYEPTVATIGAIGSDTILSTTTLYSVTVVPGAVEVGGAFVSSGEVIYAPTATQLTNVSFIPSGVVVSAPTTVGNDQEYVEVPFISSGTVLTPPDASNYLFPAPPERNYLVPFNYRVKAIPFENRSFIVPATVRHFAEVG